jgi:tetratricopeptide (TPR) repeat protein
MVIAMNAYEKKRWAETIKYLETVAKIDPNMDEAYYYIGQCMWHNEKIEEAIQYFAMAELCKGNMQKQAKEKVETLYKPLHNQTTIGIDKAYKKAADELAVRKGTAK